MMRYSGVVLQVVAVFTVILGVLGGIASLVSDSYATNGSIILVSTVVGGVLLFGIGGVFRTLADIAVDVRRSAEANERTAEASARRAESLDRLSSQRTEAATPRLPDAAQPARPPKPDVKLPQEKH
jgi:hypothetical protein